MNIIEMKGVSKYYGKLKALDNVNLQLSGGRIVGLLGTNGAGKSTLMRCLLGFLKCEGEITMLGKPLQEYGEKIFNEIAFIPDVNSLDDRLTVRQTIDYVSSLNESWNRETAEKLLSRSELPLTQKVKNLSKGMKTKLYLLLTLALDVKILMLDEPTLGLDIVFRKEFFNTILGEFYDESKTIFISTHQVEEVEHILQDIIFIDKGKVLLYEEVSELKDKYTIITLPDERKDELQEFNPKMVTKTLGHISAIVKSDVKIADAQYSRPSLSDLFFAFAGGSNEKI